MAIWHTDLQHAIKCITYWHGKGDIDTVESMMRFFNGILEDDDYQTLQGEYGELVKNVFGNSTAVPLDGARP